MRPESSVIVWLLAFAAVSACTKSEAPTHGKAGANGDAEDGGNRKELGHDSEKTARSERTAPSEVASPGRREQATKPTTERTQHEVQAAVDDEKFIINDETFEAKSHCKDLETGDSVVFVEGSASGACTSATILIRRTKERCELWCE